MNSKLYRLCKHVLICFYFVARKSSTLFDSSNSVTKFFLIIWIVFEFFKNFDLYLYFYLSTAFCAVKIYISQNLGEVNKIFQNQQDAPKYQLTFYVSFEKIPSDCFYQSLFFIALDLRIFSWIPGFYCCQHTAVTKEIFIC